MMDDLDMADQVIELTHQSWGFDKNTGCTAGKVFSQDHFVNHTTTKAVALPRCPVIGQGPGN